MFDFDDLVWYLVKLIDIHSLVTLRCINTEVNKIVNERIQSELVIIHKYADYDKSVAIWFYLNKMTMNMHFQLSSTKKNIIFKKWTDENCNKVVIHGQMNKNTSYKTFYFNSNSYICVKFHEKLQIPFTIMFVGKALGDNTYFDGLNQTFEMCHGFPIEGVLKICMNLNYTKKHGKTNGLKLNMYTIIVNREREMIVRVNGKKEIETKIKKIELDGMIIGASNEKKYKLEGCIKNFFITRQIFPEHLLPNIETHMGLKRMMLD